MATKKELLLLLAKAHELIELYEVEVRYQIEDTPWLHDDEGTAAWEEDLQRIQDFYTLQESTLKGKSVYG